MNIERKKSVWKSVKEMGVRCFLRDEKSVAVRIFIFIIYIHYDILLMLLCILFTVGLCTSI